MFSGSPGIGRPYPTALPLDLTFVQGNRASCFSFRCGVSQQDFLLICNSIQAACSSSAAKGRNLLHDFGGQRRPYVQDLGIDGFSLFMKPWTFFRGSASVGQCKYGIHKADVPEVGLLLRLFPGALFQSHVSRNLYRICPTRRRYP